MLLFIFETLHKRFKYLKANIWLQNNEIVNLLGHTLKRVNFLCMYVVYVIFNTQL